MWQAWHVWHWVAAAAVGVAGVALCDIHLRFMWQAWYLVTSTFTLCGRRGTYGIGLARVVRLGRSGRGGRRGCWRGRRDTLRHPPSFHVAGVVLGDIDCGRQGTYGIGLAPVARVGRSGRGGRRGCWRGRHGTLRHPPSFHVAGVVLGDIDLHFVWQAWQAWHAWHWAGSLVTHAHTHTNTPHTHTTYHHTQLTLPDTTYTPPQSFTISFLFPAFPMPSLPFFCCLLEEVDMWGYPVL